MLISGDDCRPEAQGSSLYPNEIASDFAFIPFGGGMRKCVGDQFALLEATAAMAMLLRSVQDKNSFYIGSETFFHLIIMFGTVRLHISISTCVVPSLAALK